MLQLEEKRRIVEACYPIDDDEALKMWHDIKPIKFGDIQPWTLGGVDLELASYQVPQDASYLLITRVECYVFTNNPAVAGFGQHMPPPTGNALWVSSEVVGITTNETTFTPTVPAHLLLDTEEFLLIRGDNRAVLRIFINAPFTTDLFIRTLVYGYLIGALVAGKIGDAESTYFSNSP